MWGWRTLHVHARTHARANSSTPHTCRKKKTRGAGEERTKEEKKKKKKREKKRESKRKKETQHAARTIEGREAQACAVFHSTCPRQRSMPSHARHFQHTRCMTSLPSSPTYKGE
eukprot:3669392-Rhodomonas_salina.1